MGTTRRDFLKASAMLAASTAGTFSPMLAARAFAQSDDLANMSGCKETPTLIAIYLRGGADPLSTMIPFGDDLYYRMRPTIAVPQQSQDGRRGILRLNNYWGFHPAAAPLVELFRQDLLTTIMCVGSKHPTRSHFDAQDFMERAAPGIKTVTEGWLNRYLSLTQKSDDHPLRAIAMQSILPRSLRGQYPVAVMPRSNAESVAAPFASLYACEEGAMQSSEAKGKTHLIGSDQPKNADENKQRIMQAGYQGVQRVKRINELMRSRESKSEYPSGGLGPKLRQLAKIINIDQKLEVAGVDYNGWDHHAYQGSTGGIMARMLDNLSQSIGAFVTDIGPHINNTVILVMSEFGRTVKENGNNGSDHGHGGFMMAIGGPVAGGKVMGKWSGLQRRNLYQGRDLPVHVDFRDVFASVLTGLFSFDHEAHDFFPKYSADNKYLKLFKTNA
ncbi:DUF1501 domain-containing protein [Poriferisphaera sp. WC338]|uniref:DUF1501 domain-containing protein n=1 Tax=Poriferisphaera sp. WC338 TaxID=3425129 RepID=UPI003D816E2E